MTAELILSEKKPPTAEDEAFKRKNVFYRSIQRLKRKKKLPVEKKPPVEKKQTVPPPPTPSAPAPPQRSVSDSVISNSPSLNKLKLPGMQSSPSQNGTAVQRSRERSDSGRKPSPSPNNPSARNRERSDSGRGKASDSGRKASAPPEMIKSAKSEIDIKANGKKSRPFSMFSKKEEPPKQPSSPKPDHFRDVKLKKTITETKVVPKTTERYKLFESVYQVSLTAELDEASGKLKLKPVVSWSHPPLGSTQCRNIAATEKIVPEFAFPDLDILEVKRTNFLTETYAFVQTDMSAARTVGYCRRFKYKDTVASRCTDASVRQSNEDKNRKLTRNQRRLLKIRVWCIVTKLHCFDTFSMIFDEVHKIRRESTTNADSEVFSFLKSIGEAAAPLPGYSMQVQYISKDSAENEMGLYDITRPGPEDRINLLKNINLLNKLSKNMLIIIMTALFTESKVLFLDKSLSSLTSTLHALTSLLYPLKWVCIYIPMLSVGIRALVRDLVQSPSPYVIGMLKNDYSKVREYELKDTEVLVVDLTRGQLDDMRDEEAKILPISEASRKSLKHQLREVKKNNEPVEQSEIWRSFLKPYLGKIDELCYRAEKVDGIRRIPMASYIEEIKELKPGDEKFAQKLFSTQMSQLWLQKQRLAMTRH
ncbi:DENN domain-containing protein 2D-like isoform X3 [Bolinopsis microptera]|uniref:DENN domain-containing protein 2D-like isoform X3 n=2 Tax=Bolinopsis microptera TaxID=2820187 RepID=UPI00307A598D